MKSGRSFKPKVDAKIFQLFCSSSNAQSSTLYQFYWFKQHTVGHYLHFLFPWCSLLLSHVVFLPVYSAPSRAVLSRLEFLSNMSCQDWRGEKDALSNECSGQTINTEVLSLYAPQQHILLNPWLGKRAPWTPLWACVGSEMNCHIIGASAL